MSYDVSIVQQSVGSGITKPIGSGGYPLWLIVANNNIAGSGSGTPITLNVSPIQSPPLIVSYGEVRHFYFAQGIIWFQLTGNGANTTVIVSDKDVPLEITTVVVNSSVTVANTVNTDIGQAGKYSELSIPFTGGQATANGVWEFTIKTSATSVTINSETIAAGLTSGQVYTFRYNVAAGTNYTVGGGTVESGNIHQN